VGDVDGASAVLSARALMLSMERGDSRVGERLTPIATVWGEVEAPETPDELIGVPLCEVLRFEGGDAWGMVSGLGIAVPTVL